ncbi:MAM domain-containing glycosylphosphatidylinositol anchor protein 1 GPI and [Collichthys lucidus]|uniref:MAM domain-containing glycosylphosphatidylinositol anchor protein 1 GPI and n=1 Tax=Collichthys lucidus TaxID=240159 RepID=A0A4U5U6I5_COLLU|nr:MAM domain-containing glycosylphosphatidylinositol anchor protein 1 GPI and [Collichthys lucidus]
MAETRRGDLDIPVLTVHQTISDVRGSYYQEKTVFLRCTVNSNPPARFIWKRGNMLLEQSKDSGVDIYEPLYTQVHTNTCAAQTLPGAQHRRCQGETKVLKLKNLRPKDFADYTCQVSVRNVCNIEDKSVTFRLTNATTPPMIRLSVNDTVVVDPGQDVLFTCEVTAGFPLPTVTWSRYPGPLPLSAQVRGPTLILRAVTPADAGFYNCTAVNNVGNPARKNVNLVVRTMTNLTFQITPDSNKDSETIQMGRDLKLSCHVDATPQDKVNYTWYKNGAPVFNSDSLILLRSDPDMAPGTSSLEIVDLKFRDLATYSCMANFPGSRVPELRVDVNISQNSVSPPVLAVPPGGQVVSVREGGNVDLVCLVVDGKPRPPILWSRTEKDLLMPGGKTMIETPDGRLRLKNVSRDMMGLYRCQTAPYNGLNIKRRETQVQLKVQCKCLSDYAPTQPTVTYNTIIWIKAWLLVERTCAISCNAVWCKEDWL